MARTTLPLERIERYYDAVPRSACRVEQHGPLTLFISRGAGWPYYARPRRGRSEAVTADQVHRVRARQRILGLPEAFEWVAEVTPSLRAAAEATGLEVREHPLLVLERPSWRPVAAPPDVRVAVVDAAGPDLAILRAVASLAFEEPGTAVGRAGRTELLATAAAMREATVVELRDRMRRGLTVMAAASDAEGPLAVGSHSPAGAVTEVTGVGTLPAARRRGLAAAVTSELVGDALARGVEIVFLSAAGDDVARVYQRVGFTRLATALIAEPRAGL